GRDHVMRHETAHAFEPERRELVQDFALVGNPRAEDVVERGDSIRCDDEQIVADAINVADLAAAVKREIGKRSFEQGRGCYQEVPRGEAESLHHFSGFRFRLSVFLCPLFAFRCGHLTEGPRRLTLARVARTVIVGPPPRTAPLARCSFSPPLGVRLPSLSDTRPSVAIASIV